MTVGGAAESEAIHPRGGVGGQSGDIFVGAIFEIEGVANKAGEKRRADGRVRALARRTRVTERENGTDFGTASAPLQELETCPLEFIRSF